MTRHAGRLEGLSIVIVGGTAGLGLSAACACLREGARLTIVGREDDDVARAATMLGDAASVIAGDASDPAVAERAIADAFARTGRVDGLFHVAGGSGRRFGDGPLDCITDDGWRHTLEINLTSLFNSCRAAARHFVEHEHGGSVLAMSSVLAWSPSPEHFATHAYAAAKAGAIGLMRSCAAYYAPHDIRFNTIAPSLVDTPGARRAAEDPAIAAYIRGKQPLDGGRIGHAEDVDGAVVYFLSSESRFVTGQVLAIDGGWDVSEPRA